MKIQAERSIYLAMTKNCYTNDDKKKAKGQEIKNAFYIFESLELLFLEQKIKNDTMKDGTHFIVRRTKNGLLTLNMKEKGEWKAYRIMAGNAEELMDFINKKQGL